MIIILQSIFYPLLHSRLVGVNVNLRLAKCSKTENENREKKIRSSSHKMLVINKFSATISIMHVHVYGFFQRFLRY